jgi:hypothetical protein
MWLGDGLFGRLEMKTCLNYGLTCGLVVVILLDSVGA